jgi:MFS family permease
VFLSIYRYGADAAHGETFINFNEYPVFMTKNEENVLKSSASYSIGSTIFSQYATPALLSLGGRSTEVGIMSSLMNLFAALVQPFAARITRASDKRVCLVSLLLMVVCAGLLSIAFFLGFISITTFIFLILLFSCLSSIFSTFWFAWLGNIVLRSRSGKFLGKRNFIAGIFSFLTTLFVGYYLSAFNGQNGFAFLFLLAFLFMLVTFLYVKKIDEVKRARRNHFFKPISKDFKFFMLFISLIYLAVYLASPFFAVYALNVMAVGYAWYAVIFGAEAVSNAVSMRYWGKIIDRYGMRNIFVICGFLISLVPFFWAIAKTPDELLLANIFSGFVWAGFDLATINYVIYYSPNREKYLSTFKFFTGLPTFFGPLFGAYLSSLFEPMMILGFGGLQLLLLSSFLLRIIFAGMAFRIKEIGHPKKIALKQAFLNFILFYPAREFMREIGKFK